MLHAHPLEGLVDSGIAASADLLQHIVVPHARQAHLLTYKCTRIFELG